MFEGDEIVFINLTEPFMIYMKASALLAVFVSAPWILYQLWAFVAPGLYDNERRAIFPFVIFSTGLFAGGAIFGYSVVFPIVFQFFSSWDNEWVVSAWTMKEVFGLTTRLFLAFGVAFELPLFVFFLSITGIVSAKQLFAGTPYAIIAMFLLGALLTPPDVVSQVLLAGPMIMLYLAGAAVAWIFDPQRRKVREKTKSEKEDGAVANREG